jgi:2-polyprenyl-3-methyl-5-hydroxy-6-metoxy-1,4-benzoquinol methylase
MKPASCDREPCRVCGHDRFSRWGSRDDLDLFECERCGLVFFLPYPTERQLEEFYNQQYHQRRGYDGISNRAGELRKQMYQMDVAELEATIPVGGRFLDVGCAEGVFLTCLSATWEKHGIDLSREAVERAAEKPDVTASTRDIAEVEDQYYDVIHLRGVFEHLLHPDRFFATARRKLRPGGHLVISTTPNARGPVPRLFRGRYKLVLPNEHVNYFSPRCLRVLAARHDFSVVRVTYPYFGTPYCAFGKDLASIPWNYLTGKLSPPFWRNIFSAYLRRGT